MHNNLDIHHLSLSQIDDMIKDIWTILSETEQQQFQTELANVDNEYHHNIQQLIQTKLS